MSHPNKPCTFSHYYYQRQKNVSLLVTSASHASLRAFTAADADYDAYYSDADAADTAARCAILMPGAP